VELWNRWKVKLGSNPQVGEKVKSAMTVSYMHRTRFTELVICFSYVDAYPKRKQNRKNNPPTYN
jgi:hypothetical protein